MLLARACRLSMCQVHSARVSLKAQKKGGGGAFATPTRNERSWGHSLLHGQDMGKLQDHRNSNEQWLAVGGWQVGGGCSRSAVGHLGAVLKGCP